MDNYKVKQLKIMLEAELKQKPEEQYGAHLTHWARTAKSINIDAFGEEALTDIEQAELHFLEEKE